LVVAFPLTLTLSLGEREQPLNDFDLFIGYQAAACRDLAKTLGAFLPLRWGEGRGEGKQSTQMFVLKKRE